MKNKIDSKISRVLTGVAFAALVLGSLFLNQYVFFSVLIFFAFFAGLEFSQLSKNENSKFQKFLLPLGIVLMLILTVCEIFNDKDSEFVLFLWLIIPLSATSLIFFIINNKIESIFKFVFGFFYIFIPFYSIIALSSISETDFRILMMFLLGIVWLYDTSAYYSGMLFGKNKLAPVLSPKKTWEGFAGGIIITSLIFVIFHKYLIFVDLITGIILVILITIFSTLGDLFESALKRHVGVKDSGTLLPGHGGVLDRFDSLLFSAPVFYLFFKFFII